MKRLSLRALTEGTLAGAIALLSAVGPATAFPEDHWTLEQGQQLEIRRDWACFSEARAGERWTTKDVSFDKSVVSAEVFLSGFHMWYTREGHDHEVIRERVDAWVIDRPSELKPNYVRVKLMYNMQDEDTGDSDDFTSACIGFTVIARTK